MGNHQSAMLKSTAALVVFLLLAAVSSAPHGDGPPPPSSVISQAFFIYPPPKPGANPLGNNPTGGGSGPPPICENKAPEHCDKDHHTKTACTEWGKEWAKWMTTYCPKTCGLCGGGDGGPGDGGPPGGEAAGGGPPGVPCDMLPDEDAEMCEEYKDQCNLGGPNGISMRKRCKKTCCKNKEDLKGCNKPQDTQSFCKQYRNTKRCATSDYLKKHCPTTCGCFP